MANPSRRSHQTYTGHLLELNSFLGNMLWSYIHGRKEKKAPSSSLVVVLGARRWDRWQWQCEHQNELPAAVFLPHIATCEINLVLSHRCYDFQRIFALSLVYYHQAKEGRCFLFSVKCWQVRWWVGLSLSRPPTCQFAVQMPRCETVVLETLNTAGPGLLAR